MPPRDADEEFEFLVNLLASDGVESDRVGAGAAGSHGGNHAESGLRIQSGSDGKLDLGQVRAFYEKKSMGPGGERGVGGKELTDGPWLADSTRNRPGNNGRGDGGLVHGQNEISVSRSVSDNGDQTTLSPSSEHGKCSTPGHADSASGIRGGSSSRVPERWVDLISETEAKQLLLEISGALRLKLTRQSDPRSPPDGPRTLNDVKNIVEFLVRMDELVWRRSEYGANHEVFDSKNILAMEERIRLWERVARGSANS